MRVVQVEHGKSDTPPGEAARIQPLRQLYSGNQVGNQVIKLGTGKVSAHFRSDRILQPPADLVVWDDGFRRFPSGFEEISQSELN